MHNVFVTDEGESKETEEEEAKLTAAIRWEVKFLLLVV